uniref:A-kinase interacting protein 1 n=2 Tax=Canis lupus familiaris TaxID=9615 RepID=A0A8C0RGA6_CANLF
MENCLAAAALNGVDRRALQRTARLGREVLERARTRAADWRPRELPRSSVGGASRERPAAGPQRLLPGQKYYSSVLEEGGAAHVSRYHRGKSTVHLCWDMGNGQKKETSLDLGGISQASECALAASQPAENISKDLYIEVYPGTYSVTVGTSDLTRTQVVAVDSGQSVDLVFPI